MTVDRRGFLARLPALPVLASAAAGAASASCAGAPYITGRPVPGGMSVALEAFGDGSELYLEEPANPSPIYVRRVGSSFTAVRLRCTHRGCQPEPAAERLVCPCHGSEFEFDGAVLQGPAAEPLESFTARVEGGDLILTPRGGP